jgi:hypothetical protein
MHPARFRSAPARLGWRPRALAAALGMLPLVASATASAATTHVVTTCDDTPALPVCNGDDGTLRQALWCAGDGDVVDLTQVQCSKITLAAPLIVGTLSLIIDGPDDHRFTIDAGNAMRAIVHNGRPEDTLSIDDVAIINGRYENPYTSGGGGACIYSSGNLYLTDSEVSNCYLVSSTAVAKGGAIFAKGNVALGLSTVSGSTAVGLLSRKYDVAMGGGIYADDVTLFGSTISGNAAVSPGSNPNDGGGIRARHVTSKYSTIARNSAKTAGGISATQSLLIQNSTISGNNANSIGGVLAFAADPVKIYNSTIAFNGASAIDGIGGLSANSLRLDSTIIANNNAAGLPSDFVATGTFFGANNLIMASRSTVPAGTLSDDPQLGPLRDNGGVTYTHAPAPGSVAVDHGNNEYGAEVDQRGFLRVAGKKADIGAVESEGIFSDGFDL